MQKMQRIPADNRQDGAVLGVIRRVGDCIRLQKVHHHMLQSGEAKAGEISGGDGSKQGSIASTVGTDFNLMNPSLI